jgi:hypothetical protein
MPNDIHDRLDRARALARENIDKAGERAKSAGSKASEKLADARTKADEAIVEANRIVAEHPLAAIAAAVTVGAVAAYLFPKTARHVRAAAPKASGIAPTLLAVMPKLASVALAAKQQAKTAAQTGIEKASAGIEVATETLSEAGHQVEAAIDKSGIRKKATNAASKIASRVRKIKDQ